MVDIISWKGHVHVPHGHRVPTCTQNLDSLGCVKVSLLYTSWCLYELVCVIPCTLVAWEERWYHLDPSAWKKNLTRTTPVFHSKENNEKIFLFFRDNNIITICNCWCMCIVYIYEQCMIDQWKSCTNLCGMFQWLLQCSSSCTH